MNPYAVAQQTVEALANGALQGVAVLALVAGAVRVVPGMNAATRHAVWFTSLLLIAALPLVHGLRSRGDADEVPALAIGEPEAVVSPEAPFPMAEDDGTTLSQSVPIAEPPAWEEPPAVLWSGPAASPAPLAEERWIAPPPPASGWNADSLPQTSHPEPDTAAGDVRAGPVRWGIPVTQGIAMALVLGWLIPAGLRLL
ncbi:MAG: hypothetical protein J0L84_04575, partial [Verrucomicrobia bacterium]|nr:hypothetical protein [Verrucomicrobiota bacterium]